MTISRTRRACALAALALLAPVAALAQTAMAPYPSQPIKFVVPYPAGGATDTLARTVG
jgi:tripartite-type tricarboxylate transporter receptor subunit TctC